MVNNKLLNLCNIDDRYKEIYKFKNKTKSNGNYCRLIFIYTLIDPDTNLVRYVGKTDNPLRRYNKHINAINNNSTVHIKNWIKKLNKNEKLPIFEVIDIANPNNWEIKEKFYIKLYKYLGADLCNIAIGGNQFSKIVTKPKIIKIKTKIPKIKEIKIKKPKLKKEKIYKRSVSRYDITKDILIDLYINKNFTRKEISEKLSCKERLIKKYLMKFKIIKPHFLKVEKDKILRNIKQNK